MTTTTTSPLPPDTTPPTYEDLAALELSFEDIDTEIIARQELLSRPLYTRRHNLVSRIPNFWPLVFEQAPPEIDQYIQPTDSQIFATCLVGFGVERFETVESVPDGSVEGTTFGEPRSLKFRFEFSENEWFENRDVEKRFWYRRAKNGWAGRVSEPIKIDWKKGKDVTGGLLDAAVRLFEAEKKAGFVNAETKQAGKGKGKEKDAQPKEHRLLKEKVESSTEGSQSFFTWFGYRGLPISAEESAEATQIYERKKQRDRQPENTDAPSTTPAPEPEPSDSEKAALESRFTSASDVEIFPDGEDLAISLAEDLWPSATKYFVSAQEADGDDASDSGFEASDLDEEIEDEMGSDEEAGNGGIADLRKLVGEGPPNKKRRT